MKAKSVRKLLVELEELLFHTHGLANNNWEDVNQSPSLRATLRRNMNEAKGKSEAIRRKLGLRVPSMNW
jgi:hypothetical protein